MNNVLDMALDDIIQTNKLRGGRRGGRGGRGAGRRGGGAFRGSSRLGGGPLRVRRPANRGRRPSSFQLAKSFLNQGSDAAWSQNLYEDVVGSAVRSMGIETGTKLYVSNLDYGVSNEDIKELFSEVGDLKRSSIHYDRSGRSKGTAEVVFSRRQDAVAAMKRYNNVHLDGKPVKIELIGTNLLPSIARALNGAAALRRGRRTVVMTPGFTRATAAAMGRRPGASGARGRGFAYRRFRGRGRGRGRGRPPLGERKRPTVAELDADLEKYHHDAKGTS